MVVNKPQLVGIPSYPEFRDIQLADKASIESFFELYPTEVSERTFGSMFVWRVYEGRSMLSTLDGHLLFSWFKKGLGRTLFAPAGPDPGRIILEVLSEKAAPAWPFVGIYGVTDPLSNWLSTKGATVNSLRDDWDYVYRRADLVELQGPRYHTQRKELKKATLKYDISFEHMTKDHQKACLELEERWCDIKHCTADKYSSAEDAALREAILHKDELGFIGGVAFVEGRIQALAIGERLNAGTAVVHFEKANPEIRGLYQFINQQFCEVALSEFEFVNREQDVGEPGLRRAKEGYHADHFVEKAIIIRT